MNYRTMSQIVILDTVLAVAAILVLLWHMYFHRLDIKIDRTFWRKVPFGLTLVWQNEQHTARRGIYWLRWRNPDRIVDHPPKGTMGNWRPPQ